MFHSRTINGDSGSTSGRLYFGTIAKNVWYDFVVHVKWSTDPNVGVRRLKAPETPPRSRSWTCRSAQARRSCW